MFDENVIVTGDETNPDDTKVKEKEKDKEKQSENINIEESNEAIKDEGMSKLDDINTNNTINDQNVNSNINLGNETIILNNNSTSNNTQNLISQMGHLITKEKESTVSESTPSPSKEEISSNSSSCVKSVKSSNKSNKDSHSNETITSDKNKLNCS